MTMTRAMLSTRTIAERGIGPARAHMTRPCENCPYRKDAPLKYWDRTEFENVMASERSTFGAIFSCHKHKSLAPELRGFCAGWLLDQRKRGVPSIAMRIELLRNNAAADAMRAVNADGLKMFRTARAMCRANGVRWPKPNASRLCSTWLTV